jgi:glycine/D-amino acid oxidase-like deaminating enzyme
VRHEDILLTSSGGVSVAGITGSALVFCEGHAGAANPWFSWLKWKSAKGEILNLSIPALAAEKRIINRGGWLLPTGDGSFRSGATYTWDNLNSESTEEAGNVLRHRLQTLLRVPWEVTGHQAAVRPILHQSLAKMGRHPSHPALVFFNGLGSKGVLHGPRYARMLAENLVSGVPLPDQLDVAGNH